MGRGQKWTQEESDRVVGLYVDTRLKPEEIAVIVGRTRNAVAFHLSQKGARKYSTPLHRPLKYPEVRATAVKYRGVKSASEIASMCGVTKNSIISHWRKAKRDGEIPS